MPQSGAQNHRDRAGNGALRVGTGSLPNIVFFVADDQGPWALGCAGNNEIRTPNLDRLASEGTRFDNFFCASPVCSPARATLLTGRIPSQHGIHDWLREGNTGADAVEFLAGQTGYTDVLTQHGYKCGLSGKWHLGDSFRPQKGYTHWYVHQKGGGPYYNAPMIRNGQQVEEPGYVTDLITDDALSFLDTAASGTSPFCLSVHYTAPHSPWIDNHPTEIVESYDSCRFESAPHEPIHPWAQGQLYSSVEPNFRENVKGYFAAVTAMDANVGRILNRLDSLGLADTTLVLFTSDNGFSCGHHGIFGKGNATFPLNMFENSVKVPFLARLPGVVQSGAVRPELVSAYDVFPTILDMVGVPFEADVPLPGSSFVDLLRGERTAGVPAAAEGAPAGPLDGRTPEHSDVPARDTVVVYDEYGPVRMIRTTEWKYVYRYPYGPNELYHLADDPGEMRNLINDPGCEDVRRDLRGDLVGWFHRYVDPALDGSHEPVTGKGQLYRAGTAAAGRTAFQIE